MWTQFICDKSKRKSKFLKVFLLFVFFSVTFFGYHVNITSATSWYNASWGRRIAITIDHTKVGLGAEDESNFPVLISLTGLSNIKANGADIRFTSSDGTTELPREIESYSSGTLVAQVKVPTLSYTADTVIYMYYDNSSATEPAASATYGSQNVWTNGYGGVWHMNESSGNISDSTSHGYTATVTGSPTYAQTGQVGKAITLGSGKYFIVNSAVVSSTPVTFSAWFNSSNASTEQDFLWEVGPSTNLFGVGLYTSKVYVQGSASQYIIGATYGINSWHYITGVLTSNSSRDIYYDGANKFSQTTTVATQSLNETDIGTYAHGTGFITGSLDEVRISSAARSSGWINTEYKNQNSTATFYSVASEEVYTTGAEILTSSNYKIEDATLDAGGELSSSANYKSRESIGNQSDGGSLSSLYKIFAGFFLPPYPGIPNTPALTNTGGALYNSLDFVVNTGSGQQADTNFAIAISSDNFVTTNFIQADDTVGGSPVWQTYTSWGGSSGQRVTGLSPSATYKIKVKARYGQDSETGYSAAASAATIGPQITFSIAGVSLGTVIAGQTTTIGTTANAMTFSTLPVGSAVIAAQQVTVSTNATGGYSTTLFQDGNLRNTANSIAPVAASNAVPAAWPGSIPVGAFGYHTTASSLCTGVASRFATDDTYAAATTTPSEIACSTGPAGSTTTSIVYKLQIGSLQQAGTYVNTITYIATAVY